MAAAVIEGAADAGADVLDLGAGRHGDGLFRGRRAGPRRRRDGHRLAQPEAVHGDEDRAPRRAARRRRVRPARRARPRARGCLARGGAGPGDARGHLGAVRRPRALVRRPGCAAAACASSSTLRTGWPASCCRRCSRACRCSTSSPATSIRTARSRTTSPTRCCRRTASSSSPRHRSEGADFGVAYDGDADRCFFVDDTGEFVPGDFITALFAETILGREPGGKVIYDVRASRAVPRDDRARRRRAADQPGRSRVHQAAHARGGRGFRR